MNNQDHLIRSYWQSTRRFIFINSMNVWAVEILDIHPELILYSNLAIFFADDAFFVQWYVTNDRNFMWSNPLVPAKFTQNRVIFKQILVTDDRGIFCGSALRGMSYNHRFIPSHPLSHHLSRCGPSSMLSHGVIIVHNVLGLCFRRNVLHYKSPRRYYSKNLSRPRENLQHLKC